MNNLTPEKLPEGVYRRGHVLWVRFSVNGKVVRRPALDKKKRPLQTAEAAAKFRAALRDKIVGGEVRPERSNLRYEDGRKLLEQDWTANGRKSVSRFAHRLAALDEYFAGWKLAKITTGRLRTFVADRQAQGCAAATVNRDLAYLRRIYKLAVDDELLSPSDVPVFKFQSERGNARRGFCEHGDYVRLRDAAPDYLRPIIGLGFSAACAGRKF